MGAENILGGTPGQMPSNFPGCQDMSQVTLQGSIWWCVLESWDSGLSLDVWLSWTLKAFTMMVEQAGWPCGEFWVGWQFKQGRELKTHRARSSPDFSQNYRCGQHIMIRIPQYRLLFFFVMTTKTGSCVTRTVHITTSLWKRDVPN